jgi:hypothetical protein
MCVYVSIYIYLSIYFKIILIKFLEVIPREEITYNWKNIITNTSNTLFKNMHSVGCWWLMPVILATQEAETRRISVW